MKLLNLSVSLTLNSSPNRGAKKTAAADLPPLLGEVAMRSIDGEVLCH